jgi:hypothetical protein
VVLKARRTDASSKMFRPDSGSGGADEGGPVRGVPVDLYASAAFPAEDDPRVGPGVSALLHPAGGHPHDDDEESEFRHIPPGYGQQQVSPGPAAAATISDEIEEVEEDSVDDLQATIDEQRRSARGRRREKTSTTQGGNGGTLTNPHPGFFESMRRAFGNIARASGPVVVVPFLNGAALGLGQIAVAFLWKWYRASKK